MGILNGLMDSVFAEIIAAIIIAFLTLLIFDVEKLKYRFSKLFGINFYKTFERVSNRKHVIANFNRIFVSYKVKNGGKILLMSNTGGYPEFDPYTRIAELSTCDALEIYLAVTQITFQQYVKDKPAIVERLIDAKNVYLYLFDNLIPYKFRIGINTDLGFGFYCAYYGHKDNKVSLEGIQSTNSLIVEGIENMFYGLLNKGMLVDRSNLKSLLGYSIEG